MKASNTALGIICAQKIFAGWTEQTMDGRSLMKIENARIPG